MDGSAKIRWISSLGLGVRCDHCLHRAVLRPDDFPPGHGIMRRLADLRFKCSKCGGRRVDLTLFRKPGEVTRFWRD